MVEGDALLRRLSVYGSVGSNPTPSIRFIALLARLAEW